ncbi:hypothetical protein LMG26411_07488 [Cupriavidus numazuensis]|uniref:Uncharacterized protein n=1 Tax=Cupriavidus numazuensis TaxID=221992 RepID=A0ABM8TUY7_9BURK|nr:hypothetical protein LMG26411_07488 [Cupriavidus numazuensis]
MGMSTLSFADELATHLAPDDAAEYLLSRSLYRLHRDTGENDAQGASC